MSKFTWQNLHRLPAPRNCGTRMNERDRILARIAEIEQILRHTTSDDVRLTLHQALADWEKRLAPLDGNAGAPASAPSSA